MAQQCEHGVVSGYDPITRQEIQITCSQCMGAGCETSATRIREGWHSMWTRLFPWALVGSVIVALYLKSS